MAASELHILTLTFYFHWGIADNELHFYQKAHFQVVILDFK